MISEEKIDESFPLVQFNINVFNAYIQVQSQ